MSKFLCAMILLVSTFGYGDLFYTLANGSELRILMVEDPSEIPQLRTRDILVSSFMTTYEDVPLIDLSPDFKSTGDVRRFYYSYFSSEYHHFIEGKLIWLQAFINDELVGFATYEFESPTIAYMNLIAVAPEHQMKGIGKHLVFSILSYYPAVEEITLLIRKVNTQGLLFYTRLGFEKFNSPRDNNFVDMSLLEGLHWQAK